MSAKLKMGQWNYPLWGAGKQNEWKKKKAEPNRNMEYHKTKYTGNTGIMGNKLKNDITYDKRV